MFVVVCNKLALAAPKGIPKMFTNADKSNIIMGCTAVLKAAQTGLVKS